MNNMICDIEENFTEVYKRNLELVFRLSYISLSNYTDAEDAVQSVFLKYLKSCIIFNDLEHEKAWFIVTTRNHCKDILKSWWKSRVIDLENIPETINGFEDKEFSYVSEKLLKLPEKYKTPLYLYYFEGYSIKEISKILNVKESTIQTRLHRGRKQLKIDLGGEYIG